MQGMCCWPMFCDSIHPIRIEFPCSYCPLQAGGAWGAGVLVVRCTRTLSMWELVSNYSLGKAQVPKGKLERGTRHHSLRPAIQSDTVALQ